MARREHGAQPHPTCPHVRLLGPTFAASLADSVGAGVHANTLLPWNLPTNPLGFTAYKYGVVSADAALDDLLHWRHLALAGRMQKPVASLCTPDPSTSHAAADVNLRAALAAALLVLPERFPIEDLHRVLCGLSYRGDVRVALGAEDARKISCISRRGSAEGGSNNSIARRRTPSPIPRWLCARRRLPGVRARGGVRIRARGRATLSRRARDARCRRWAAPSEGGAEEAAEALARKGGDVGAAAIAFAERTVRWSSARQTFASALVTSPDKASAARRGKGVEIGGVEGAADDAVERPVRVCPRAGGEEGVVVPSRRSRARARCGVDGSAPIYCPSADGAQSVY